MTTPQATDWSQFGLADIWDMVRKDNFDNFSHVRAWQKMQILCHGMADSLRAAAAELAQRWPPDQSPAAAAFKERLEELALVFSQAGDAANSNGPTLAAVNHGFASSHGKLAELCRSWEQMERDEFARVAITRRVLTVGSLPSIGLLPIVTGLSDHQVLHVSNTHPAKFVIDQAGAPGVPTNWRQELDNEARVVMTATDREISDASTRIRTSPVLKGDVIDVDWPQSGRGRGGIGFSGSGFIPPPAPTFPAGLPERPPTPGDPILDGGAYTGGPGGGGSVGPFPAGGGTPAPTGGGQIPWVMTPTGPAMAPGGVIGERPPAPRAPLGAVPGGVMPVGAAPIRPAGGAASGGFVAPPGGMIGGAPVGRGGASVGGAAAGRAVRRRGEDDGDWVVPAGGPGVLRPDPEPDVHDPGPGVIGIDR